MFGKLWFVIDQVFEIAPVNIIKSDYWGNLGHFCWLIFKITLKMPRYIFRFFSSNSWILNNQVDVLCRILKQDLIAPPSTLGASYLSAVRPRKFEPAQVILKNSAGHFFLCYSERLVAVNFLEFWSAKVRGQAASGIVLASTLLSSNLSAVRPRKFEPARVILSQFRTTIVANFLDFR